MFDKRYLHHLWTRIRPFKTWYFVAAAAVFGMICVFALRANYTRMTQLRSAVYTADQQGGNVEKALQNLRAYVGAHMNTQLYQGDGIYPPIQLKYTYERLQKAEQDRVASASQTIYTDAQHHCEALYPGSFSGGPRVPCIEQYVKDHPVKPNAIPDAMYKFDFVSPSWSPDLAGWTLVVSIVFLLLGALRFLAGIWLKALTK